MHLDLNYILERYLRLFSEFDLKNNFSSNILTIRITVQSVPK